MGKRGRPPDGERARTGAERGRKSRAKRGLKTPPKKRGRPPKPERALIAAVLNDLRLGWDLHLWLEKRLEARQSQEGIAHLMQGSLGSAAALLLAMFGAR
jgi:hypothetical protein